VNLSQKSGLLGAIARYSANAGKRHETFRFDESTFLDLLERFKMRFGFGYDVVSRKRDILVVIRA
jgi:hypothetical protein